MKYVMTIVCCLAFAVAGVSLAISDNNTREGYSKHLSLSAATLPTIQARALPLDLQLDLGMDVQTDSTIIKHDTVFVDRPQVLVINKKSPKVNKPKGVTDYVWMFRTPPELSKDTVSNKVVLGREENPKDVDVGVSNTSAIQLIVDGQTVYSKNVNHSTGESQ